MPRSSVSDGLKTSEYVGYALGDAASNFFFQTFNIFLTYYYVDVWGIPATALLWIMPIVRLMDTLDDPILGITLAFSIVPGVFALLKAGALLIYPLD